MLEAADLGVARVHGLQRLPATLPARRQAVGALSRTQKLRRAIEDQLQRGPLVYRYTGMEDEESPFVACSFWLAAAMACVGRIDEATALMDQMVDQANDVGLFSEMLSAVDGEFMGNIPQGLSHLALIQAALTIEEVSAEQ